MATQSIETPGEWLSRHLDQHRERLSVVVSRRVNGLLAQRIGVDDVLQEVFVRAEKKLATGESQLADDSPEGAVFVWLYGMATDVISEIWSRATRQKRDIRREGFIPEGSSFLLLPKSPGTGPLSAAGRNERNQLVQRSLAQLRESDREIIALKIFDVLSFAEIASLIGISENTASQRYGRAKTRLKTAIQNLSKDSEFQNG